MEPDRYRYNPWKYICGMCCLLGSLTCFAYVFYLLPYLIFHWHYHIPDLVASWIYTMQRDYRWSFMLIGWIVFLSFFIPAMLFTWFAKRIVNHLENRLFSITPDEKAQWKLSAETKYWVIRVLVLVICVFLAVHGLKWLISR